jgi:hypothetical protein
VGVCLRGAHLTSVHLNRRVSHRRTSYGYVSHKDTLNTRRMSHGRVSYRRVPHRGDAKAGQTVDCKADDLDVCSVF